jgi:hypothetical protein
MVMFCSDIIPRGRRGEGVNMTLNDHGRLVRFIVCLTVLTIFTSCSQKQDKPPKSDNISSNTLAQPKTEPVQKSLSTQWDHSYGKLKWGASKSLTKQVVDKSLDDGSYNEPSAAMFHRNDMSVGDDELRFMETVNGKRVKYCYYYAADKLFMVVKDFADQGWDVQAITAQELRKHLEEQFGMNPASRQFPKQVGMPSYPINHQTVIETWNNAHITADLEYEATEGGGFVCDLSLTIFVWTSATEGSQIEQEKALKDMSKRQEQAKKDAKELLK